MSASSKTMKGALPPSSIELLTTRLAPWASSSRPTSVEPVKDSLRTRGSSSRADTTGPGVDVVTTFTTPAGTPASVSRSARARAVSGVSSAGLSTTGQPAASAGPILRVAIAAGKSPRRDQQRGRQSAGCMVMIRLAPDGDRITVPSMRTASSAFQRKNSAA